MAISCSSSSSPSTSPPLRKYHVFLSFRGVDTRSVFVGHLYEALGRAKIDTFIDYGLDQGEEIDPTILSKIEESMISVVIFSERYADSKWCLDELVQIFKCKERDGQVVLPVFYRVDPGHVSRQTGPFGDGFANLAEGIAPERRERYANILTKAANISGLESQKFRDDCALKVEIVRRILKILNSMSSISIDNDKYLVRVDSSIKEIKSLLQTESKQDHCIVAIWGMGGIGKTTIAKAVYENIKNQFENFYFIDEVRKKSKEGRLDASPKRNNLGCKRVLIVLDDVMTIQQIKYFIGDFISSFGPGSRLIITTRDKGVLKSYEVPNRKICTYKVERLSGEEALKLFSWSAFERIHPSSDYDTLSKRIVEYANGVPLALEQLGYYFRGVEKEFWENAIEKIKEYPNQNIQDVLKLSYDELDERQKMIFLDIAFFFRCEHIDLVKFLVGTEGNNLDFEIKVMINKCLISILNNKIMMNDLLQVMAKQIVRKPQLSQLSPEERSRLCYHKDILQVLKSKTENRKIEGLCLDMAKIPKTELRQDPFAKITKLKFFKLHNSRCEVSDINKVIKHFNDLESDELMYLCWYGCLLRPLCPEFKTENLVVLDMPYSPVVEFSVEHLVNLKHINLSHSKDLVRIRNLSCSRYLKSLILEDCTGLLEISSCIDQLNELVMLNLMNCRNLRSLPNIWKLISLEDLHLLGCSELIQNGLKDYIADVLQMNNHPEAKSCRKLCICFPQTGTEILERFCFQDPGSYIFLRESDGWSNQNVISFVLYTIIDFGNYQFDDRGLKVGYDLKQGSVVIRSGTLRIWDCGRGPCHVNSDHVFLSFEFHVPVLHVPQCDEMTIQFCVKDLNNKTIDTCKVKNCGFCFLHNQDFENPRQEENEYLQNNGRRPETSLPENLDGIRGKDEIFSSIIQEKFTQKRRKVEKRGFQ